jgi:hypothetical protein
MLKEFLQVLKQHVKALPESGKPLQVGVLNSK